MKFLILFGMLLLVEAISPEQACIWISLVIVLAIDIFEHMRVWFALLHFKSWEVGFSISLATPWRLMIVISWVGAVAFNTLHSLYSAHLSWVSPFPTFLALRNSWVHVCSMNSCNKISYIEAIVNEFLSICTALRIPDVDLYNSHIQFGRDFDDPQTRYKGNVIKDIVVFEYFLNVIQQDRKVSVFSIIRKTD